jgi:amino-acid N-acetyltransferase
MTQRRSIVLRTAGPADAKAMHALIETNVAEGHLLPRTLEEVHVHASRFVVATRGRKVVGCGELAPLSSRLAEVRSLAVHADARHQGIGTQLVTELRRRAQAAGYEQLCVMTHAPEYFANLGFSIVPHLWVPEKVFTDCVSCPKFRACGQFAMVVPLDSPADDDRVPDRPAVIALQLA